MSTRSLALWLCATVFVLSASFALRSSAPDRSFGLRMSAAQGDAVLQAEGHAVIGAALGLGMLLAAGIVCLLPGRWLARAPWLPVAVWTACFVVPATAAVLAVAMRE